MSSVEFWQERYRGEAPVWSGRANAVLVDVASDLPPGRAVDLGCGEGGDALWLASRGWQVTAVDIASNALDRGRASAEAAGVAGRIEWVQRDLSDWSPGPDFDLVSAFFLQSPVELAREQILRHAAAAVAPGGHLLLVSHAAAPPWATQLHTHHDQGFPTPAGELEALALDDRWEVLVAEVRARAATGPDGRRAHLDDTVVFARRRA